MLWCSQHRVSFHPTGPLCKHRLLQSLLVPANHPDLSNVLATPDPPEQFGVGRHPRRGGRPLAKCTGGGQKGAQIPAPSAGNPGVSNLEPDVSTSCSAPLREGRNPAHFGKRGVDSGPLHAWVWVGSVTPRGGVTDPSPPKALPTVVLASALCSGEGNVKFGPCPPSGAGDRHPFQLSVGRRGLQDPRVGGSRAQRSWGPGLLGSGRWASRAPLVRNPGSCPHFLPFLAPAVGAGGRGGERKGREGPGAWRGGNGGAEKPRRGLGPGTRLGTGDRREQRLGTRAAPTIPEQAPVSVWDEEEDGAIFTVTSRQYRPLDPLAPTPPPRSSRRLRAGTLEALVRHLLDARTSGADVTFTSAFLATHRAFTSTPALLGLVADRLEALESHPTDELERTIGVAISVLSTWLASHPEDFGSEVKGQLDRLESFLLRTGYAAGEGVGGGSADLIRNLRSRVDPQAPDLPKSLALPGDPPADPTDVLVFLADHLAEQLTLLDAELFLNLVPSQCLGSLWGHRDRPGHSHLCPSVRATVTQFNKVAGAVVSSVLGATSTGEGPGEVTIRPLRPPQRARLLEKWIRVAEECRLLRNFSSVYAVVSALQSSPIHRLRAAWGEAARDSLRVFSSLCQIFSEEDNYSQSRELLLQEAKLQPSLEPNSKKAPRSGSRGGGVVPYLGTFLKDLVMLDAASKDELENGYINFDKRRKEFAVLSELRRLQNECRGYDLRPDPDIQRWLQGLRPLTEAQSHRVSCEVEPPGTSDPPAPRVLRPTLVISQWTE
nr:ral guanine nucleotide dissociation stimulator-like 2 isoform X3 [Panthera onca]